MNKRAGHQPATPRPTGPKLHARPKPEKDYFGLEAAEAKFIAARDELLRFWRTGRKSLEKHPTYPAGPNNLKTAEARKLGWNPERLRQARLFASRCSPKELEKRIAEAYELNYPPHWSILVGVYQVTNKKQRESIWRACLVQNLSRHELAARVRGENLDRDIRVRVAGRTAEPPKSSDEARIRLSQEVAHLLRVQQVCRGVLHPDGLPVAARRALERAVKGLRDFQATLALK